MKTYWPIKIGIIKQRRNLVVVDLAEWKAKGEKAQPLLIIPHSSDEVQKILYQFASDLVTRFNEGSFVSKPPRGQTANFSYLDDANFQPPVRGLRDKILKVGVTPATPYKDMLPKEKYPRIYELGIPIHEYSAKKDLHVIYWKELNKILKPLKMVKVFSKVFGVQTCSDEGAYPWDVEAVLERIISGRLTGTQLFWD